MRAIVGEWLGRMTRGEALFLYRHLGFGDNRCTDIVLYRCRGDCWVMIDIEDWLILSMEGFGVDRAGV